MPKPGRRALGEAEAEAGRIRMLSYFGHWRRQMRNDSAAPASGTLPELVTEDCLFRLGNFYRTRQFPTEVRDVNAVRVVRYIDDSGVGSLVPKYKSGPSGFRATRTN